eukprot:PhM_4_TR15468/c0_g1_i2/m.82986
MSITRTEHFRNIYRFGFNNTAARAALLLSIFTHQESIVVNNGYILSDFTTEDVLAFCIDATRVLLVDIADEDTDVSNSVAPMCLVVDDHRERSPMKTPPKTGWCHSSYPRHFIFASMPYSRALDWIQQSHSVGADSISVDMTNTYYYESDNFFCFQSENIVELTFPSTVTATSITNDFLTCSTRLTYLDLSSLSNVRDISVCFLSNCSTLTSLDLSPLSNITKIGKSFLS